MNSDDPAMFNTTLTDEYLRLANAFTLDTATVERLVLNAAEVTLLPVEQRVALVAECRAFFAGLPSEE